MRTKRKRKNKKKTILKIIAVIIAAAAVTMAVFAIIDLTAEDTVDASKISAIPKSYSYISLHPGKVEKITYKAHINGTNKKVVTKHAEVYLPYGYDKSKNKNKKYDIMYLVHGYGGTEKTFLGSPDSPREFKYILDHMISRKVIRPLIVVTPTFTIGGESQNDVFNSFEQEVCSDLIPAIETKYRTYAKNVSPSGITASRSHRIFGGFSMGGSFTWLMLKDHTDYYKYYMPMSCPLYFMGKSNKDYTAWMANAIDKGVANSGYNKDQYFIFSASGTRDFTCHLVRSQVGHLKKDTNEFTYTTKDFNSGNLMFHAFKGHYHKFSQSYVYIYNGLIKFFAYSK